MLLASLCLVGCFPYHYTLRPGLSGVILDETTSTPIANASVIVTTREISHQIGEIDVAAASDGTFRLSPKQRWGIYIIPMDVFGPWTDATVTAPGYANQSFKLSSSAMGPKDVSLGDVRLTRSQ
jgi:hypothetical protein